MDVAFLGMGIMGAAMANNLLKAGLAVTVYNRTPDKPAVAALKASGATVATSLSEAASSARLVFTCLGDELDVESVLTGADGAFDHFAPGTIVVDFSTIGPVMAVKIAAKLATRQVLFLDAPVTGGDVGAKNGTLTIMVGGDSGAYEQVKGTLAHMGKTIVHCGKSGNGQALKLCNQILCAVNLVAVVESFALAERLGLDPQLVVDTLAGGAGGSWALSTLGPRIIKEDFAPGFAIRHMLKDLRLVDESVADQAESAVNLDGTHLAVDLFNQVIKLRGTMGQELGTQAMQLALKG